MSYPLEKYKYFTFKNDKGSMSVAAVSTFAGKKVRAVANCDPTDEFDLEKGKMLAAARCNKKVATKRLMRATDKYVEASLAAEKAIAHFEHMRAYFMDSVDQFDEAVAELDQLMENY